MRQSGGVITDRAARLPGDLLLQAVEGMDRPLFVLDEDWRFSYINPAGAAVLGRTVDELVGRVHLGGVPRGRRQPLRGAVPSVARDRVSPAARRPGSSRWGSGSRPTPSSPTPGLVVTYDDVTDRRRAEDGARRGGRRPRGGGAAAADGRAPRRPPASWPAGT